jgi:YVTN family beta-propeller protein
VTIVELASGERTGIELAFTPDRLIGSTDGYMVAAANLAVGTVAFIELVRGREVSRITGLSSIRDLMFGADAAFLYVAAEGLTGIGVVDVARGKLIEEISVANLRSSDVTGLTRSPSGRTGYVKTRGGAAISLIDLRNFRPIGQLDAGLDAGKAFPTGSGGYLVVPDNSEKIVTIVSQSSLTAVAMLEGAAEMATVYSGWFDTIALVPSSTERKLLVYDLDRLARAPDIPLPGKPGPGAVTPDGAKLYIALEGAKQVAVIDLRTRRLTQTIPIGSDPVAAIMGRSFDICH